MTFEQVYQLVEKSSHETAFNREECEKMWELANTLKQGDLAVEVGLQFGRSATVIASSAKEKGFKFIAIDSWDEEYSEAAQKHVEEVLLKELDLPIEIIIEDSKTAHSRIVGKVALLHIDGDHSYEGVLADCKNFLPKVKKGGYACFDDYGHDSLPGVYQAVTEYMSENGGFKFEGRFGNKLGVFKKI